MPTGPVADIPSAEQAAALEATRHGKKAGLCAVGTLGLVAIVLFSSKGGIAALVLLVWTSPVALAGAIAALVFGARSFREAEIGTGNRVGARLAIGCAVVLCLHVLGGLFIVIFPPSFH